MTADKLEQWDQLACGIYDIPPKEMRDALAVLREVTAERDQARRVAQSYRRRWLAASASQPIPPEDLPREYQWLLESGANAEGGGDDG